MPVASFSVVVTPDARARATNGSTMSAYTLGMTPSAEPGQGDAVVTGIMGCSGTQSESNPSSSTLRAMVATSTE